MADSTDPGTPSSYQERDTSTSSCHNNTIIAHPESPAAIVWNYVEPALWTVFISISCRCNFYWIVTSVSLLVERLCYILVCWSRHTSCLPQPSYKPILKWIALLVFLIWTVWCCSLTPLHVIAPTFMDLWTTYSNPPPLEPVEVLYDPGDGALVE